MEEKLIGLVFEQEVIWDKSLSEHKNSKLLCKLWEEIAKQLKVTKEQAKNKWKNLQTQYSKELSKLPKSKSGDGASNTTSSWVHFQSMFFLKENDVKESSGNLELANDFERDSKAPSTSKTNEQQTAESNLKDRDSKADWHFLLSMLPSIDRIPGSSNKMQFRIDALCLLFNFLTGNRKSNYADAGNKKTNEKMKVLQTSANKKVPTDVKEELETNTAPPKRKQPMARNIDERNKNAVQVNVRKQEAVETVEIDDVDIKPSEQMSQWLAKNPFVRKTEPM